MGFDIYGLAPKTKGKKPEINWEKATEKDKDKYFKAMDKFEEENPGYYFRNNVWWWRPLGELIHDKCSDLLSDEQKEGLQHNGGTNYTAQQAIKIANRLSDLIKNGYVDDLEKSIKDNAKVASKHNEGIQKKLEDIRKEVERIRPDEKLAPVNYPFPYNKHWEELMHKKSWDDSYPFSKENVKEFINFARYSGGFQIC